MRFSTRSKVSILLSAITILTLVSAFMVTIVSRGTATHAASSSGIQAVASTATKATTIDPLKLSKNQGTLGANHAIPYRSIHINRTSTRLGNAPHASAVLANSPAHLLHNFNGVSTVDSANVNGFDVEPPDQGLCVGNGFVMEPVNAAITIYHPNGTIIAGPLNESAFFGEEQEFTTADVSIQGDGRCYFDKATNTFFATQLFLTTAATPNVSHFDVAVNTSGDPTTPWTVYRFDTTNLADPGCPCFGDQPLFGIDQFNIYISTNEFSILGPEFNGAQVYAISKSQLEALGLVNFVHFSNLGIGGSIAASVQPAITNDSNAKAEYFLNSLDPFGTFDNRIGVWAMTNRQSVTSGIGVPNLTNTVITSEAYGLPPVAQTPVGFDAGDNVPTSGFIQTDDDRMQQVQFINGQLWSSLDTALTIAGETGTRSGAAWFEVHPSLNGNIIGKSTVTKQGYVASTGNYLLYPAVAAAWDGTVAMTMTLSGPNTFPSAVYAVLQSGHNTFGPIHVAAAGVTADTGFTAEGGPGRWGDYSAAVIDPAGGGIWLATEYIPGTGNAFADWGTRVFEVQA